MSAPAPAPPGRAGHTARDMAISLLILLVPVAIIVALVNIRGGSDVVVVDPGPAIAEATAAKSFPVAVPTGLGSSWRSVSAQFTRDPGGAVLRIGYVTPSGGAVQLIESDAALDGLLVRELGDNSRPTGTEPIGANRWNSYQVRAGELALVLPQAGRTIVIIGHADVGELRELAAAVA